MAPDREPRTIRVDPDVFAALEEYADEHDLGKGEAAEMAFKEFTDTDRTARIEEGVRDLDEKLDEVLAHLRESEDTHAHTDSPQSPTARRTHKIAERVREESSGLAAKVEVVEAAIKDIAGGDERTIEKYKTELKDRALLFKSPHDAPVWFTDKEEFFTMIDPDDVTPLDDYPDELYDEYTVWMDGNEREIPAEARV